MIRALAGFLKLLGEIEIIPTNDGIFDETFTAFRNFLFLLIHFEEFSRIADRDGAGKAMRTFTVYGERSSKLTVNGSDT